MAYLLRIQKSLTDVSAEMSLTHVQVCMERWCTRCSAADDEPVKRRAHTPWRLQLLVVASLVTTALTTTVLLYLGGEAPPWMAMEAVAALRINPSSCFKAERPMPFPVKAFWHISRGKGGWEAVAREQLRSICSSRLLETTEVSATVLGVKGTPDEGRIKRLLSVPRVEVSMGGEGSEYEYATLEKLQAYCHDHPDGRVLYFHNKGASYAYMSLKGYYVRRWRRLLEHFVIGQHQPLLSSALVQHGVVGSLYRPTPHPHFSGNMWAARCDYINSLPRLTLADRSDRMYAEYWIGDSSRFHEARKSCFESDRCTDLYRCADASYTSATACL